MMIMRKSLAGYCYTCGDPIWNGEEWMNIFLEEFKTGQEAANAYLADETEKICEDCKVKFEDRIGWRNHDGIIWTVLKK